MSVMIFTSAASSVEVREGMYTLRNVNSGKYLSVAGDSVSDGTRVQMWDDPRSRAARWRLKLLADGTAATLRSVSSGKYLSVNSAEKGAIAQVLSDPGSPQSQWVLHSVAQADVTMFTLENALSGLFLNVAGGSTSNGAKVHVWSNPGSSHSQWELSGDQFCHDAVPGEACYNDTVWAKEYGIAARPEWYPGLSENSSTTDVQAHLHYCYWNRCPIPCSHTEEHNCSMTNRFWDASSCEDAVVGSQCFTAVEWAMQHGIFSNPEWYPNLDDTSDARQFQGRMYQSQIAGAEAHGCHEPCCHDALPGELCHEETTWAMLYGINSQEFSSVYPTYLSNSSAFSDFQAYLHLCYPTRCPEPCASHHHHNFTLDCPDVDRFV